MISGSLQFVWKLGIQWRFWQQTYRDLARDVMWRHINCVMWIRADVSLWHVDITRRQYVCWQHLQLSSTCIYSTQTVSKFSQFLQAACPGYTTELAALRHNNNDNNALRVILITMAVKLTLMLNWAPSYVDVRQSVGINPRILKLRSRKWTTGFTPQLIYSLGKNPVPIGYEAGCDTDPICTLWWRKNLTLPEMEPLSSSPRCSLYADWNILVH